MNPTRLDIALDAHERATHNRQAGILPGPRSFRSLLRQVAINYDCGHLHRLGHMHPVLDSNACQKMHFNRLEDARTPLKVVA